MMRHEERKTLLSDAIGFGEKSWWQWKVGKERQKYWKGKVGPSWGRKRELFQKSFSLSRINFVPSSLIYATKIYRIHLMIIKKVQQLPHHQDSTTLLFIRKHAQTNTYTNRRIISTMPPCKHVLYRIWELLSPAHIKGAKKNDLLICKNLQDKKLRGLRIYPKKNQQGIVFDFLCIYSMDPKIFLPIGILIAWIYLKTETTNNYQSRKCYK